jgi:peptidoglycan/xylan/chitin deacetylase (PgdA/CDA1 family)
VITFDDGYRSLLTRALPILDTLGYTATVYLIGDYLDDRRTATPGQPGSYLGVEDVRALQSAGWELGAHSRSHPDLTTVDDARLDEEIVGSRRLLATLFDDPIATFCYPYHRRSPFVEAKVAVAGYVAACGGYNPTHRIFDLSRINGALYGPGALAARCSRWYWRSRTSPALRSLRDCLRRSCASPTAEGGAAGPSHQALGDLLRSLRRTR